MRIFVIGGTGQIGMQLVPILLKQGHDVVVGARTNKVSGNSLLEGASYIACNSWDKECLKEIAKNEQFDVIIDFPGTAWNVWEIFKDKVLHIVGCGSFWMYGRPHTVPTPEVAQEPCVFDFYAKRYQHILDAITESKEHKAEFTAIMPTNICGPGKIPLDTSGGRDIEVHKSNMRGEMVYLPEGPEVLLAPCDCYDLAMLFALAVNQREKAAGQIFNAGTAYALTATQFVQTMGDIYGVNIPISYVSWKDYTETYNTEMGAWWHFYAHMYPDITKARTLLGYEPKYTPEQTLHRAGEWMRLEGLL